MSTTSEFYMQRCIDLARQGEGRVAPNPMVGCVIVQQDKIIGEGFHQNYGEHHAEVNAINSVQNSSSLTQSTLYVNLEPCVHYGKTPPCSDLIIKKKIPRVVIGTTDPFAKVAGKGIEKMKKAGIDVTVGVCIDECLELNRRFFTFHEKKRPYIILKWAQTADGFVDADRHSAQLGQPTWITNEMARIAVHRQRATENAIFIGTETALKDNPSLTLRDWAGKQPLRIVSDYYHRLPANLTIFDGTEASAYVSHHSYPDKRQAKHIKVEKPGKVIDEMLHYLYGHDVLSVIIEGGTKMLQSFINLNLWDEAHVYTGQVCFHSGIKAPVINYSPKKFDQFYNSNLKVFLNQNSI
ncbi:MAG: bifunctional diaminohydroxyphosphoribosylaminopyrimidine deaminase/5-amino-6-(5-phosphoribosylamino)uracil reductase RibD [Prolixibacteraceae bacterium]|nr:bifunctional diaminohydroxyphosphoribosylaminopyrimidine deaminase/5-amino-6-(5-phosphoribosylamino)uracil reductase RibD [Prolixibacteraceae bacterium]